jgi:hypothetical protein
MTGTLVAGAPSIASGVSVRSFHVDHADDLTKSSRIVAGSAYRCTRRELPNFTRTHSVFCNSRQAHAATRSHLLANPLLATLCVPMPLTTH